MRHKISFKPSLVAVALAMLAPSAFAVCEPGDDVLASLRCIDGLSVEEKTSEVEGYRHFEMKLEQPVDHAKGQGGEVFQQRLVLLHKSWDEPVVLQTSGYSIFSVGLSRLARTFGANQVQVEHRYFSDSTPASHDWSKLDIQQSAADFHRVTVALKQLYRHHWVGTGASKGGMTSVFHRYFYPSDLDGTVADVAPLSFALDDDRYIGFVDSVGGDRWQDCRKRLDDLQRILLTRRDALVSRLEGGFAALGGKDVAFEHAVIELPFVFWQYGNPADEERGCDAVPTAAATDDELYAFLQTVNDVSGYGDEGFQTFASYYYQAGTELGGPGAKLDHLTGLRRYAYSLAQYMPKNVRYTYSNASMLSVDHWVRQAASGIMFVYGEYDPWSAGAYPKVTGRDMHWYLAPAANHGAKFNLLSEGDRHEAVATLARWLGKAPVEDLDAESIVPSLDDIEQAALKRLRLP